MSPDSASLAAVIEEKLASIDSWGNCGIGGSNKPRKLTLATADADAAKLAETAAEPGRLACADEAAEALRLRLAIAFIEAKSGPKAAAKSCIALGNFRSTFSID